MHYIYIYICVCVYVCDEFETASALARHMATHPKEKPFLFFEIPVHWGNIWEWSTKAKSHSSLHTAMEYSVGPSTWKRHTCVETMRVHNPDQKSYRAVLNEGPDFFQTHGEAQQCPCWWKTHQPWNSIWGLTLGKSRSVVQNALLLSNRPINRKCTWEVTQVKESLVPVHSESAWFAFSSMEPFEGLFKNTYCGKTGKTILMQRMWWFFSNVFFVIFSRKSGVQVTG